MIVDNKLFKQEIPKIHPLSLQRAKFWKEEKRRCIEGYWVQGKWMPGVLYFFVNHWHIELNLTANSKQKVVSKPFLRDLEWDKGYVHAEARGFSGFLEDDYESCHRVLKSKNFEKDIRYLSKEVLTRLKTPSGEWKKYVPAREYLRKVHTRNLGQPLYDNFALNVVDIESRGCLAEGTKVLMYDGTTRPVETLKEGDRLMGKDGTERTIQWLHSGVSNMYRVSSTKFDDIVVNEQHNLSFKYVKFNRKGNKTIESFDTIESLLEKQKQSSFTNRYYRYLAGEIPFEEKELPIDPYYLGLWLSDGRSNCTSIKTTDKILRDYLVNTSMEFKLDVTPEVNGWKEAYEVYYKDANLRTSFREFSLLNNKHIPHLYKTGSVQQRLQLLAGLIDGDGCYDKSANSFDIYCGLNEGMADATVYVARSLGLYANKTVRDREDCKRTYEVIISGDIHKIPCRLERKQAPKTDRRIDVTKSSFNIQFEEVGKFYGFHVDKDNEYLLADFTVDHNTGKSFWGSCMIAHNFLTDGVTSYADLKFKPTSETLVGAIDSFYSNGILKKVQLGLDNLEGGIEFQGDYYPPPLSKSYGGSWASGKTIIAATEVQKGNTWIKVGSKSKIQHRTFASNPFAGNGTRPGFTLIEEVGFMDNLQEALGQLKECTANGAAKFGTIWMTGTGGDMSGGATEAVKAVFYDPEAFDCIPFVDEWEGNAKPIGFFVPAWKGLNQFKDEQGNTDELAALGFLMEERRVAGQAKSKQPLNDELQQRPIKPSEAFLVTSGNVFPVSDLKDHLNWLRAQPDDDVRGDKGTFGLDEHGKPFWKPDLEDKLTPCIYPMKEKDDTTGAVVIWEHPGEDHDYGYYIAGCDPYDLDKAPNSVSLGSVLLMRRTGLGNNHDKIVAEYTARPERAKDFYETVRRLLMYYGATCLHENEKNQIKMYFEQKHSLSLLAYTPTVLKSNQATKVSRMYGQHMPKTVKNELELLTREWLTESAGEGTLNLQHIYSEPLLEELIAYNEDGNFDRVIALMLSICLKNQMHQIVVEKKEEIKKDPFFERKLFTNRRS